MPNKIANEEEKIKHENKIKGYISMGGFLAVFLTGYYYGFQYAALFAVFATLLIAYNQATDRETILKQTYTLAGAYLAIIAVGIINPAVIPVGVAGVVFTMLGIYLHKSTLKNFLKLFIAVLFIAIGSWASLTFYPRMMQKMLTKEASHQLPDFEVHDLNGNTVRLSDFRGKVVVMDFWATWCGPCLAEFSELEKSYAGFKEHDKVKFLITNARGSGDTPEKIKKFVADKNYELPFYMDLSGDASSAVEVSSFPTLVIIDKKGVLRAKHVGFIRGEDLVGFISDTVDELIRE